jgi:hypothetical protein
MSTVTLQRYRVTVALPRPAGDGALVPPAAQVLAEAAAAVFAAEDLMTAWTAGTTLLSMTFGAQCRPDALSAGRAVVRALGGIDGSTVEAKQVSVRSGAVPRKLKPLRPLGRQRAHASLIHGEGSSRDAACRLGV